MSKDIADRYKLLEAVTRRESREEDIQDFAENTMNELLAWYGYGDKVVRNTDLHSVAKNARQDNSEDGPRQRSRFSSAVSEISDSVSSNPDLGRRTSECSQTRRDILKLSPSSVGSQRQKEQILKELSSHSLDSSSHLFAGKTSHRPASVNSLTSSDSAESHVLANVRTQSTEPDYALNRRLNTAMNNKLCDWCRQVPPNINFADSVDGLNQLSFCSELCLNHYKMNLFCTETRQYLQQIQNSDETSELAVAASDNKILITPDLWMAEKKDNRRTKHSDSRTEMPNDDCGHPVAMELEDDACRHSDCGSNFDTSNGVELSEYLDHKKSRRKERSHVTLELSNETSSDDAKGLNRGLPMETVVNSEEKLCDLENCRRQSKRQRLGTSKESMSPSLYPSTLNGIRKCPENPDSLSVAGKEAGMHATSAGGKTRAAKAGNVAHHLQAAASSDLSSDVSQFRRLSDAAERSKPDGLHGSRQAKSSTPQFSSSPMFGSASSLPATPLFSLPGVPSQWNLFGPAVNPQFLGAGAASFPFLGFPSLLSMAGGSAAAGVGGIQVPPGIPVPPPVANPWSSLLPPNTLMIPYPVLLPLPIPIPIPFPVPAKSEQPKGSDPVEATTRSCLDEGGKDYVKEPTGSRSTDARIPVPSKAVDKTDPFPGQGQTIVCSCCRTDSLSSQAQDPHPRTAFCSPCPSDTDSIRSSNLNDSAAAAAAAALLMATAQANQNLVIDFSMARDPKSSSVNCLRSPKCVLSAKDVFSSSSCSAVTIKTEPLDLVNPTENNNLSSSSSSPLTSSLLAKTACELQTLPALPYLARRSLILDAPSVLKEKPLHDEKKFSDSSSKKFMYCKRRHPSVHIKTK